MKRWGYLQVGVREAVDNLPSGVCIFSSNGLLILCNRIMYRLLYTITGQDPQTLKELEYDLEHLPEDSLVRRKGDIYLLEDQSAWHFKFEWISDDFGVSYTEVIAVNVTELYQGSMELEHNIANLQETQANIRRMKQDLEVITRENEILSMKMKIHDELGSSLLRLRRYYLGTDHETKDQLVQNWKNTVAMLKFKSGGEEIEDPMADLLRSAASIGVEIIQEGELPKDLAMARLFVRAIRQCVTNAVRHAGGNRIFVEFRKSAMATMVVITNDGEPPKEEVVEGSGLSSLRKRVVKAGGTMQVQSFPVFALRVTLPDVADSNAKKRKEETYI